MSATLSIVSPTFHQHLHPYATGTVLELEAPHVGAVVRPGPAGALAVADWGSSLPLVLLIDRQADNVGASVTNAANAYLSAVFDLLLAPRAIPPQRIVWASLDSEGGFDRIKPLWTADERVTALGWVPWGNRGLAAFLAATGPAGVAAWAAAGQHLPATLRWRP